MVPEVVATPVAVPAGLRAKAAANLAAIRTLRRLDADGGTPTADDKAALAAWSSWGALPKVFDEADTDWENVRSELRDLLSDAEWDAARRTTISAHYTPPAVVAAMWEAVKLFGFDGGMILEPGCGSGNFLAAMPAKCDAMGVELDPTTAAIARKLNPTATIRCEGFERTAFPDGWFDLAIGNVPFGNITLHDPKHNKGRRTMHNHFIIKSLHLLAPGGLAALITSRYTMDSQGDDHRAEIAELGELLGAVRLPSGAMRATAGTDVVVDVLFLRRRYAGGRRGGPEWQHSVTVDTPDGPTLINEFFAERPGLVLGTLRTKSGMYRSDDLVVKPFDDQLEGRLRQAIAALVDPTVDAMLPVPDDAGDDAADTEPVEAAEASVDGRAADDAADTAETAAEAAGEAVVEKRERRARKAMARRVAMAPREMVRSDEFDARLHQQGSILRTSDLGFCQLADGILVPFEPTSQKDVKELTALIDLRDTVLHLLDVQASSTDDSGFVDLQAELNARYDAYVAQWGPLNRFTLAHSGRFDGDGVEQMRRIRPRMGGFGEDPAFFTVMALEHFDPDDQTAAKADVFSNRVVGPRSQRDTAESPEDALSICLDEIGRVDADRVAELLGLTVAETLDQLGTLVWSDPATGRLVPAAEYLSGNVREKLAAAQAAAVDDNDRWAGHVAALQAVMPDDLGPGEIDARLGSPWVEASDIEDFIMETFVGAERRRYANVSVDHSKINSTWEVSVERWVRNSDLLMTSTWGTPRADAIQLVHSSLNQTPAAVYDLIDNGMGGKTRVLNQDQTFLAREKQQEVESRFREWVWENPARADRICELYNRLFNSVVLPKYDGSHLTLPGLNLNFTPHPHQLNAIWRVIQSPTTLLAHPVGAGKTMAVTAAGMEMRRLGLVNKPAYVVPNHMLDQFATEMMQLYPLAKVMVPTKKDMTSGGRKQFVAKCAMGDWDAVVLTHSAFERIPVSAETAQVFIGEQIDAFREAADAPNSSPMTVKKLEAAVLRLEQKQLMLLAAEGKDDGVNFEATGIDYVFVDESQAHKNLPFPTHIRSVGGDGSQRAADLQLKLACLRRKVGDRVTTFSTATPIANTIAEMFVVMKYLTPDRLAQAGIENFDAWAATFGETITMLELAPDGGSYRMNSRFAKFHNVPELITMFREVADVLVPADLNLPGPTLAGGKPTMVIVPTSDQLADYVAVLVERAKLVRDGSPKMLDRPDGRKVEDNMLVVCTDGRKAALDLRLVDLPPDDGGGKLTAVAERVAQTYQQHKDRVYFGPDGQPSDRPGAFQLVFCDLGTPRQTWNAYDELQQQLVGLGVPGHMIRFIHEAKNDRAKAEMFAACRAGRVAVLIGSTNKMGIGTNVQTRLVALHHIDCPWRPDEIEQREGRGLRQGNQNSSVEVLRYAREGSFDVYMWQTVERKANFIHQVMRGEVTNREIEDISEQALSYAEIKALATGNPLIMEKAGVDNDVARLLRLKRAHLADQQRITRRLDEYNAKRQWALDRIDECESALEKRVMPDPFHMVVGDVRFDERAKAGEALREQLEAVFERGATGTWRPIGEYAGFTLQARCDRTHMDRELRFEMEGTQGWWRLNRQEVFRIDPLGIVMKLQNAANHIEHVLGEAEAALAGAISDTAAATARQGEPFDQEHLLASMLRRQSELEEQMKSLEERPTERVA